MEELVGADAPATPELQLHEQVDAHVAQVDDRAVEPLAIVAAPGCGRRQEDAVAAPAGSSTPPPDATVVDQLVEGPVDERSAERPDAPEPAVGGEHRADRPAVIDAFDDEGEAHLLGEVGRRRGPGHGASVEARGVVVRN